MKSFYGFLAYKFVKWMYVGRIVGDEADGVPGIQHLVPGFGMKTALKLLKKHGSLQNLLNTAAIRSVVWCYQRLSDILFFLIC